MSVNSRPSRLNARGWWRWPIRLHAGLEVHTMVGPVVTAERYGHREGRAAHPISHPPGRSAGKLAQSLYLSDKPQPQLHPLQPIIASASP